ncbi:MAG TPA: hypothetical protein DD670_09360 [Planctomycetaceae bacterium]|nr:hypothetical protein [Planctomycetaceae bacterium]
MQKNEIQIGEVYLARVTDKLVSVRIDRTNRHGGWDATNLATGRKVRIKSAQRLRGTADATRSTETPPSEEAAVSEAAAPSDGPVETKRRAGRAKAEPKPKRASAVDAAARVLAESDQPMSAKQIIEAAAEKGYWKSPGGKTPHATLYSAIIREIAVKGQQSRFRKADRGRFVHA